MVHRRRVGVVAGVLLVLPWPVLAEEYEVRWSATLQAAFHEIASQEADDHVTGFFDQYEYTPNKDDFGAFELGVSEAMFDLLGPEETPKLRFRLASPTSNLGFGQPGIGDPFLNQRALLLGNQPGFFFDLDYWRMRTEDLRQYSDPTGTGLTFTDLTNPNTRFYEERTGFDSTLRFRPQDAFKNLPSAFTTANGELELRGGYESRDGKRQRSFLLAPTNDWLSIQQDLDQEVGTIGGGLLVAPAGLFTLALDVDHQRFREAAPTLTGASLGAPFPSSSKTIGFVPDTERTTGSARIRRRFGERAELRGGFQISLLEQVPGRTPDQQTTGLDHNQILFTSANVVTDLQLVGGLSANGFFKYDERNNDIDRNTSLFNAGGGTQVDEFLKNWRQIVAGGELVYAFLGRNRVSVGVKAEWVDRDLDFVPVGPSQRILRANAWVSDDAQRVTYYGRTRLRPLRGLDFRAELGYRNAPETGYLAELDHFVYGSADASYVLPTRRPAILSTFVRGSTGENHHFEAVDGTGPTPAGPRVERDFDRTEMFWGVTATTSPWKRVTLFSSFFQSRDAQDYDLVLSNVPRFVQDVVPLVFTIDGPIDYRSDDIGVLSGASVRLDERSDLGLSYSFNRIKTRYRTSGSLSGDIESIESLSRIDADIHRMGLSLGHRLREGLRVTAGYRFDLYDDHSPVYGTGSVQPFDLGTHQHTVTLGVTLTNALLE